MRIGAYGERGLLFFAAKRSGAFPPNMPAGLRARVSRLGGFMRPFLYPEFLLIEKRYNLRAYPAAFPFCEGTTLVPRRLTSHRPSGRAGKNVFCVFPLRWNTDRFLCISSSRPRALGNFLSVF